MNSMGASLQDLPYLPHAVGQVVLLEAEPGPARRGLVDRWLEQASLSGGTTWLLPCAFDDGGALAGVKALLEDLLPDLQRRAPELVERHSYEICLALPIARRQLPAHLLSLTETAPAGERVRNYAADRAYRSLHGLIDLLAAWHRISGGPRWAIACDEYDRADGLTHGFFAELLRRRGQQLGLSLLVVVAPGQAEGVLSRFDLAVRGPRVRASLPVLQQPSPDAAVSGQAAQELERQLERDLLAREMAVQRLVRYWRESGCPENALRWQVEAMLIYNHRGLYEASAMYCAVVEASLEHLARTDRALYIKAASALFFCYVPLHQAERAQGIVERALESIGPDPSLFPRFRYLLGMLHARFLPTPNFDKAAEYLEEALNFLERADLATDDRHFLTAFTMNGLALVRVRQGRPEEAVNLCHQASDILDAHLRPDQHRLHRSVLHYNIAQVYAVTGPYEEAIRYFSAAIEMDPNYAEYHHERGTVYFKMERLEQAVQDYLCTIRLSPPYVDVWANLGQSYRAMGRMEEAADAYSVALDLRPDTTLALVGRAEALASLGRSDAALADYATALTLEPNQSDVLASRATLYLKIGRIREAVVDFDRAISLAPDVPDFYYNRAAALEALGRDVDAACDLRMYLQLQPGAEDRGEVEATLASLAVGQPVGSA